ncbi:MAG TPA: PAS domain-containing protein [Fimbriimonadaceae bacterium]|nr:PAS domain-containing protein [Fimbriimonadaceae bacterium]
MFPSDALDLLPSHIALLDSRGTIVAVNAAWRRFADENGLDTPGYGVGTSYYDVAHLATLEDEGEPLAVQLEGVLHDGMDQFHADYPCHSPSELRWFRMNVSSLDLPHGRGALVAHTNITERILSERCSRVQYHVTKILSNASSVRQAAPLLLDSICRNFEWEVGELWLPDPDSGKLAREALFSLDP